MRDELARELADTLLNCLIFDFDISLNDSEAELYEKFLTHIHTAMSVSYLQEQSKRAEHLMRNDQDPLD